MADPVASGIVSRLDRPGGNITGFAGSEPTLAGKWLELLSEIAPGLKRAAIMFSGDPGATEPTGALSDAIMHSFEMAARSLRIVLSTAPVQSDVEIERPSGTLGASLEVVLSSMGVDS